jgi:hypothetical protein
LGPPPQDDALLIEAANVPPGYLKSVSVKFKSKDKARLRNLEKSDFMNRQTDERLQWIKGLRRRGANVHSQLYPSQNALMEMVVQDIDRQVGGVTV